MSAALADRYVIERELGAGGMATVYLAHDVRHDRKVALKVLRPELAAILGGERFLAEIKTTANLQHPHILSLFDSGEADGLVYYVMPYVEGESLRDRLTREKQLPVEEAVRIAREVADALAYAHQHGIVHRDIKPENILLHGGHAMVAYFGIALAASRSDGGTRMTETGMSLGTPHYMSPEQAMGEREITPKADIYALGCVLYEMLTAEPPFVGATAQAIIARVMTEEPRSLTLQRKTIPPSLEAAVQMALAKLPADRFSSAAEFAAVLGNPTFGTSDAVQRRGGSGTRAIVTSGRRAVLIPWAVAVAALMVAAWSALRPRGSAETSQFVVGVPESLGVRAEHSNTSLALSPDGRTMVYVGRDLGGRRQLLLRRMGQLEPRPLAGTENAEGPFFSPDGLWVAFFAEGKLKKVALAGGPPLALADAPVPRGGAWGPDGSIVFSPSVGSPLLRVSSAGGPVDTVTHLMTDSGETSHRYPDIVPGGGVIFTRQYGSRYDIAAVPARGGAVRRLVAEGITARYAATRHLVYGTDAGGLIAVPFNARTLEVAGSPVSLLEGMLVKPNSGVAEFALSPAGTLAYLAGRAVRARVVLVDRRGTERLLTELLQPGDPRFSPDGRRVALVSVESRTSDVRVFDIARGTLSRLSFEGNANFVEWTPDGRRVAFSLQGATNPERDIYWAPADGSGQATPLWRGPLGQWEISFAPGGKLAAVRQTSNSTGRDLLVLSVDSPQTLRPWLATTFEERAPAVSPDGRWLAYLSNESGRDEIYVRAFPEAQGRWQVSAAGGSEPRWARSGRELYYRNADSLIGVAVASRPTFSVGTRQVLFVRPYLPNPNHAAYDVSPDNRHFVMIAGSVAAPGIVVALDWFAELKSRTGAGASR